MKYLIRNVFTKYNLLLALFLTGFITCYTASILYSNSISKVVGLLGIIFGLIPMYIFNKLYIKKAKNMYIARENLKPMIILCLASLVYSLILGIIMFNSFIMVTSTLAIAYIFFAYYGLYKRQDKRLPKMLNDINKGDRLEIIIADCCYAWNVKVLENKKDCLVLKLKSDCYAMCYTGHFDSLVLVIENVSDVWEYAKYHKNSLVLSKSSIPMTGVDTNV